MKTKYLEELKRRLEEYEISETELQDILDDYAEMIDDALQKNMSEEEIINLIGSPRKVVRELRDDFMKNEEYVVYDEDEDHHHHRHHDNKIVALMPFISLIIFFILGFGWNLWHPGWLVFLSIPVTAIIVNVFDRSTINGLVSLSPFFAVIVYLAIGFIWNIWHPTWLIFLIIPVLGIFSGSKKMRPLNLIIALSPFILITTYILLGTYGDIWHPTWLMFLLIPMLGVLNMDKFWKVVVMELAFIVAIGLYLVVGYVYHEWILSLLVFLVPLGVSMIISEGEIHIVSGNDKFIGILTLVLIAIYFGFGFWLDTWAFLWMIFLFVPMAAIIRHAKGKNMIVALMPFIAVIIFFSLGFFFGFWAYSWLAFLLIPMTAILVNA